MIPPQNLHRETTVFSFILTERKTIRKLGVLHHLWKKQEQKHHKGHKETPTTRASPFIVHTSLFHFLSESGHIYSNQSVATEALHKSLQNK